MTGVGEYKKQIGEAIKCILGALFFVHVTWYASKNEHWVL